MKNLKLLSNPIKTSITCLIFLFTTSLFVSSCQKDELQLPDGTQTAVSNDRIVGPNLQPTHPGKHFYATVNDKQLNPPLQPPTKSQFQIATVNVKQMNLPVHKLVFKSITIDHYAAATHLPDYSISVNANGTATYDGRFNVNIKGSRVLEVSKDQLEKINTLCRLLSEEASTSANNVAIEEERKMAHPFNRTTFVGKDELSFWSKIDDSRQPKWLVSFRIQVEQILSLSYLINIPGQIATVEK